MRKPVVVDRVTNCARCGGVHCGLKFTPLTRPCDGYTHWAMCLAVREPILMAVVDAERIGLRINLDRSASNLFTTVEDARTGEELTDVAKLMLTIAPEGQTAALLVRYVDDASGRATMRTTMQLAEVEEFTVRDRQR
jgi:hypothetical protein